MEHCFIQKGDYTISTDKQFLRIDVIHQFLHYQSYWAKGIPLELVKASIENSTICYGVYKGNPQEESTFEQVGFARVVTDLCRFAWLGDVFILPEHRGQGLSKWLVETITSNPFLSGTSFHLGTKDAHGLYERFGFNPVEEPANKLARPINWEQIYKAYDIRRY